MLRAAALSFLVLSCCVVAWADELTLQDGRTYVGIVTVAGEQVVIKMDGATLSFPRSSVARIVIKQTPEQEFAARLEKLPSDDVKGLFALGNWASQQNLPRQAAQAFEAVLKAEPDHPGARRALGHVRIDGKWHEFSSAMELARGKLSAGAASELADILPALEQAAPSPEELLAVRELLGLCQMRRKLFAEAQATFADLAAKAQPAAGLRYGAIAEILKENGDGMYVVREPYPPAASLTSSQPAILKPGPASLADLNVLSAALLERARKDIDAGRALLAEAAKVEASDPDGAAARYNQATKAFDRADALVGGLAGSYRIEIARRRIAAIRRLIDADARKYDDEVKALGKTDLSPQDYKNLVVRWIRLMDNIRDNLKAVLAIAAPYSRELVLEIQWAQADMRRIERSREILTSELEDIDGARKGPR